MQVRPRGANESPAEWIVGRAVLFAAYLYVGVRPGQAHLRVRRQDPHEVIPSDEAR